MFLRTNNGLSNRALFTDADYTMYVEGGGGVLGAGSSDVIFWGDVVRTLRPDLRISVVAYGGKAELEIMAEKIRTEEVANTVVAMDSDFDELLKERKDHPCILYTYGYSWENDAYCQDILGAALCRLLKVESVESRHLLEIHAHLERALDRLTPLVNADLWLRTMRSSLFPKASPGRFVSNAPGTLDVCLNVREVAKVFKSEMKAIDRNQRKRRPPVWIVSSSCFLHGHTMHALMKCVLNYSIRLLGKRFTVADDLMEHIMISVFCRHISSANDHRSNHYRDFVAKIT